jgi:hypothetical protein
MRTALEISQDIVACEARLRALSSANVYGKTREELTQINADLMDVLKDAERLKKEQAAYLYGIEESP